jgi:hypothetical protein
VYIGITAYALDSVPSAATNCLPVLRQSYLIPTREPVQEARAAAEAGGGAGAKRTGSRPAFELLTPRGQPLGSWRDAPLRCPAARNACLVTEVLLVPLSTLELPLCYLAYRSAQIRERILAKFAAFVMDDDGPRADDDDWSSDEDHGQAADPGGPLHMYSFVDEMRASEQMAEMKALLRQAMDLLPWMDESMHFMNTLRSARTVRGGGGDRAIFMKSSLSKALKVWAFMPTNTCHHRVHVGATKVSSANVGATGEPFPGPMGEPEPEGAPSSELRISGWAAPFHLDIALSESSSDDEGHESEHGGAALPDAADAGLVKPDVREEGPMFDNLAESDHFDDADRAPANLSASGDDFPWWFGISTGCPAAHVLKFKEGGLLSLSRQLMSREQELLDLADDAVRPKAEPKGFYRPATDTKDSGPATRSPVTKTETLPRTESAYIPRHQVQAELSAERSQFEARAHVVMSQALSIVAAAFLGALEVCCSGRDPGTAERPGAPDTQLYAGRFLQLLQKTGKVVVQWESLLSTWGKELGMLEDLVWAIKRLDALELCCAEGEACAVTGFADERTARTGEGSGEQMRLSITVTPAMAAQYTGILCGYSLE